MTLAQNCDRMTAPLIGLSAYREQARSGVWDQLSDLLAAEYAQAVERAGGVPVLLPVQDPRSAATIVDRLDGLLLSGGGDVEPKSYGAVPHLQTREGRPDRDAWELALLDAAGIRGTPTLGVCRGMQVMAVRAGGSLEQHLPDRLGSQLHSPSGAVYGTVDVSTLAGSKLRSLVGPRLSVGCHHHQSVSKHPGMLPAAYAADGTLEAMEDPDRLFWLAVQWHPETRPDTGLFRGLVDAARR